MEAASFLSHMNHNTAHTVPPRVAVIGGGNTAVDAAVCAKRRGGQDVYLVYRRSYEQMPAWPKERDEALHAGVHLMLLCQPTGYVTDASGRVSGLRVLRTRLGPPDADGRRKPQAAGGEFVIEADMVIEAIGEGTDAALPAALSGVKMTPDGLVQVDGQTLATTRANVYAAGDLVNGGTTVVQAIAEGRRAAAAISNALAR
jgi:NADPH-dependent glutamate synthase beta subunit-like oxidoreductase